MPRKSIAEALESQSGETTQGQPRRGFDAAKFNQLNAQAASEQEGLARDAQARAEAPLLRNVGTGAAKSLAKTGLGVGQVGRSIQRGISSGIDKLFGTSGFGLSGTSITDRGSSQDKAAREFLAPRGAAEKTGSFAADVAQFAVPSARVGRMAGGARGVLGRAVSSGGVATLQEGELSDEAVIAAGTEVAVPVVGRVARPVLNYGKGVLKGLAGSVSGAGEDVIERAIANPQAASQGLRAGDEEALKTTAKAVRQGVKDLRKKANQEYGTLTNSVSGQLDSKPLKDQLKQTLVEEADAVPTKSGLRFNNTPFVDAEERQLEKVYNIINEWDDFSPQGVNKLATRISRFRRGTQDTRNFDRVIDGMRRQTREYVGEQVPEIAEANRRFANKMDLIDELDSILKTDGAVESRQGLRETSQRIARLFNANKDLSREAVDELEKEIGVDTLALEAGRQLSDSASRFQTGASDSIMQVVRTLVPRRVVGEIAVATGRTNQAVEAVLGQKLQRLDEPSRAILVETLTELYGQESEANLPTETEQDQ